MVKYKLCRKTSLTVGTVIDVSPESIIDVKRDIANHKLFVDILFLKKIEE